MAKRKKVKGDRCRVVVTYQMGDQVMHEVLYAKRAHITTHGDRGAYVHLVNGCTEDGGKINFATYWNVHRIARHPQ